MDIGLAILRDIGRIEYHASRCLGRILDNRLHDDADSTHGLVIGNEDRIGLLLEGECTLEETLRLVVIRGRSLDL